MQPTIKPLGSVEPPLEDTSPDGADRIEEFLIRHGGAGESPNRCEGTDTEIRGWSEIYAADGYALRCDWSRTGGRQEMRFSEVAPRSKGG